MHANQPNIQIFQTAVKWAQVRQGWLRFAAAGHATLNRRQCLNRARWCEDLVLDYAVRAERSAQRDCMAAARAKVAA